MGIRSLPRFDYLDPPLLDSAVELLATHGSRAKILGGGVDLVPRLRSHELTPRYVVDLQRIKGLDHVEGRSDGDGLRIGALARLWAIELSPAVRRDYPALHEAVHQIRSVQVKTMATAVGNLCVATPASDVAAALIAYGASLTIASSGPDRTVPVEEFYVGLHQTVLGPGDIVTGISLPAPPRRAGSAFAKLVRTAVDIAKVNVAVMLTFADDICQEARIALGSIASTVVRATSAEAVLAGQRLDADVIRAAAEVAASGIRPISDVRSTAAYRREATRIVVGRTVARALARADAHEDSRS